MENNEKQVSAYQSHIHEGILLNANELSQNLNENIIREIQQEIPNILFNRYPDDDYTSLKKAYAKVMNVKPDMVLCGNGSDQMLGLLIGCAISKEDVLVTLEPDFGMYDYYVSMNDGKMKKFPIQAGHNVDIEDLIEFSKGASMLLFSNPNNPTGNVVPKEKIERLLQAMPEIPVVIDEAYMEFSNESVIDLLDVYPNLFVTRTLSKAFGAAGIRLGFLLSNAKNIEKLSALNVPYSISRLSQMVGEIVLFHADEFQDLVRKTIERREQLVALNQELNSIEIFPSQANFVLVQSKKINRIIEAMNNEKITIRVYDNKPYCRITIGSKEENEKVMEVLRKVDRI